MAALIDITNHTEQQKTPPLLQLSTTFISAERAGHRCPAGVLRYQPSNSSFVHLLWIWGSSLSTSSTASPLLSAAQSLLASSPCCLARFLLVSTGKHLGIYKLSFLSGSLHWFWVHPLLRMPSKRTVILRGCGWVVPFHWTPRCVEDSYGFDRNLRIGFTSWHGKQPTGCFYSSHSAGWLIWGKNLIWLCGLTIARQR